MLFDIRIVDTDARSYCSRPPMDVLFAAEEEKKRKYQSACNDRRAQFTPICVSVDGMMGKEAGVFVKILADRLSRKWNRNYSCVRVDSDSSHFCYTASYHSVFERV